MDITVFGISNCDMVRRARRWLDDHEIAHGFHDFRVDGLNRELLRAWIESLGWESVINKRSTSWKALAPALRDEMDSDSACAAALETPTLIKRPVLTGPDLLEIGFQERRYAELFG